MGSINKEIFSLHHGVQAKLAGSDAVEYSLRSQGYIVGSREIDILHQGQIIGHVSTPLTHLIGFLFHLTHVYGTCACVRACVCVCLTLMLYKPRIYMCGTSSQRHSMHKDQPCAARCVFAYEQSLHLCFMTSKYHTASWRSCFLYFAVVMIT